MENSSYQIFDNPCSISLEILFTLRWKCAVW